MHLNILLHHWPTLIIYHCPLGLILLNGKALKLYQSINLVASQSWTITVRSQFHPLFISKIIARLVQPRSELRSNA